MQTKSENWIIPSRQIIITVLFTVVLFILIAYIFSSALQSSSAFERLSDDVYRIELDFVTLCVPGPGNGTRTLDRIYAEDLLQLMGDGILKYRMVFTKAGNMAAESIYSVIKTKLVQGKNNIVITNKEYLEIYLNIKQLKETIRESSVDQKRALSTLFMLLLLMVVVLLLLLIFAAAQLDRDRRMHQFHRELSKKITESENKMHNLLSSELHDDIGQMLVFLKLNLMEEGSEFSSNVDSIIGKVRNLSHNLRIPNFYGGEFVESVEELISQFTGASSIRVEYTLAKFHNELYPDYYPIIIYRIIQECLQNALKHSKAENIRINLLESAPFLIFRYRDDGIGIGDNSSSVILRSIQDRAELLKAELKIDTGEKSELSIVMKIPFQ